MLATSVAGKALLRVRAAERGNGYEAWCRLKLEYEPRQGARRTALLIGLLNPSWGQNLSSQEFSEAYAAWEEQISRYEQDSGVALPDDIKVATVTKHAPERLREMLRQASYQIDGNYVAMKRTLEHYLRASQSYDNSGTAVTNHHDGGPTPMDVGALSKDEGKGKGKDWKGKGKGKSKGDQQKGKGAKSKGKGKSSGKDKGKDAAPTSQPFQGYCSFCWKWGHKKAECRSKAKQVSAAEYENGENKQDEDKNLVAGVGVVSDKAMGYDDLEEQYEMSWVFGALDTESQQEPSQERILGDSGSDEHCCPASFGRQFGMEPCDVHLRDIQGKSICVHGQRSIPLETQGGQTIIVTFVVADVAKPVISLGKLRRKGYNICMKDESYIEHPSGERVDLCLQNNTWYIKAKIADEDKLVAPLSAEEMWEYADEQRELEESESWQRVPMRFRNVVGGDVPEDPGIAARGDDAGEPPALNFSATRNQMRARLQLLGASTSGSKAELWARLTNLELRRRRETRRMAQLRERADDLSAGRVPYAPVVLPTPKEPTTEEIEEHCITHFPMAPWCEHCVLGRGQDQVHPRTGAAASHEPPLIQTDFMFMTADMALATESKDSAYVIFVSYDCGSGFPLAVAVTEKTPTKYLTSSLEQFIARLHGSVEVTVRCDNEPALRQLVDKMAERRVGKTNVESTPRMSSQSKGSVENCIKSLQGIIRTLRYSLEARYGAVVTPDKAIWPFMVRHSAFLMGRFHQKASGRTPFQAIHGETYNEALCEFGETILVRHPVTGTGRVNSMRRSRKADTLWCRGIWLGRTESSSEHLVGVAGGEGHSGIISARTVRRLVKDKRVDRELFTTLTGAPWQPHGLLRGSGRMKKVKPTVVTVEEMAPGADVAGRQGVSQGEAVSTRPEDTMAEPIPGTASGSMTPTLVPQRVPGGTVTEQTVGEILPNMRDEIMHEDRNPEFIPATPMVVYAPATTTASPAATATAQQQTEQSSGPREKRSAEVPPEDLRSEVENDVCALVRERMVGDRKIYVTDLPDPRVEVEKFEDVPFSVEVPALDVEEALKKNEEEVQPDPNTQEEDIKQERRSELLAFEDWKVFSLVPPEETDQSRFIDVRWVDEWRGTDGWRCRCVAREYRWLEYRDDLFAATTSCNTSRIIDVLAVHRAQPTWTADATKAYLQVDETETVFVKPPREYQEMLRERGIREDMCWRMEKVIYGRRPAATRWVEHASQKLTQRGFLSFAGAPYLFYHKEKEVVLELHMDDYYGTCPESSLAWMERVLGEDIKLKRFVKHGLETRYSHLKRERVRTAEGLRIYPNRKYTAAVLSLLNLQSCNPVTTPVLPKGQDREEEDDDEELTKEEKNLFQRCVGVLAYLSQERPDIQYGCRLLATGLAHPTKRHMRQLRRMARYLRGTVDYYLEIKRDNIEGKLNVFGDADWGGDRTRRSLSAGVICWGSVPLFSWSRFQGPRALSSGEAEFCQLTTAAAEALLLQQALQFMGIQLPIVLHTDSTAALGLTKRKGVGRMRHMDLRLLWLQDGIREKMFSIRKVSTHDNVSDIGTKALVHGTMAKHMSKLGFRGVLLEKARACTKEGVVAFVSCTSGSMRKALTAAILAGNATVGAEATDQLKGALAKWSSPSNTAQGIDLSFNVELFGIVLLLIAIAIPLLLYTVYSAKRPKHADSGTQTDYIESEAWHQKRVDELRMVCEQKGMRHIGLMKSELIRRLTEHQFQGRTSE
eukprot:6491406-Amphidinium_carterae.1